MASGGAATVADHGGGPDLVVLRTLHRLIARLNSAGDLTETLSAVVDGVVDGVGFGVAAVNYAHPDGSFEVMAVAGPTEARAALLGSRLPPGTFEVEFAVAEEWGALRFVPHERVTDTIAGGWVPSGKFGDGPDGWHPLDALFAPLHAPSGQLVGVLSVDLPADGRRPGRLQRELLEMFAAQAGIAVANARLTAELQLSEESFRLAFDGAGVGMAVLRLTPGEPTRYLRVNPALCALTGYTRDALLTRGPPDITHPDDREADRRAAERVEAGQLTVYRTQKRYLRPDGTTVWVSLVTSLVGAPVGAGRYAISQVEDITARRAAEENLRHRVAHDPLTGLANRTALIERLTAAIDRVRRNGRPGAVLFCDLDGFKALNDRLGHHAGDAALTEIASRLTAQVRAGDTVARYGGDEFVILAEDLSTRDVTALAKRLTNTVSLPLPGPSTLPRLSISIGIAALTADTPDADTLLHSADAAMYRAKPAANGAGPIGQPDQRTAR